MRATGKMISNMVKELKPGMKVQSMRDFMQMGVKRDMVNISGQMVRYMKEIGLTIK